MDSVAAELAGWLEQMPHVHGEVEAARQRIGRLSRLFARLMETVSAENDVSISDLETLSVIRRNGGSTTPSRIATELHLTSGSVSTRLRRLERAGLAGADVSDPQDGRVRNVRLTDRGLRIWREGTGRRTEYEAELFAVLDEPALAALNESLARLLARFEQEFGIASRHDRN
jgi:DNA-binding MarR family transcriptional regulator